MDYWILSNWKRGLRDDTILVSIMQVNNETGVIQDIAAMAELTRPRGILLHVDAAQSLGKLPIDVQALGVDLMSMCAHKLYGPKGIGGLVCAATAQSPTQRTHPHPWRRPGTRAARWHASHPSNRRLWAQPAHRHKL